MTKNEILANHKDINWLKQNHQMIHFFGLGFIQLKLSPEFRLHFYTPQLKPIIPDEDIHDHRYYFSSQILKGVFKQKIYQAIKGDTHVLKYESCKEGDTPKIIGECAFKLLNLSEYTEGSGYYLDENTFHQAIADNAITLIKRPITPVKQKARVAHIKSSPKVCPFSKKIAETELWNIVESML